MSPDAGVGGAGAGPEGTGAGTDPIAVETNAIAVETDPVAVETDPVAVETNPVAVETNPVAVESNPVAVESNPVAVESNPVAVETNPGAVESAPVAIGINRVAVETNPVAVEKIGEAWTLHPGARAEILGPVRSRPAPMLPRAPLSLLAPCLAFLGACAGPCSPSPEAPVALPEAPVALPEAPPAPSGPAGLAWTARGGAVRPIPWDDGDFLSVDPRPPPDEDEDDPGRLERGPALPAVEPGASLEAARALVEVGRRRAAEESVPEDGGPGIQLSVEDRRLLRRQKELSADVIERRLQELVQAVDPRTLIGPAWTALLRVPFDRAGVLRVQDREEQLGNRHGGNPAFAKGAVGDVWARTASWPGAPLRIGVRVSFHIPGGSDDLVLVFELADRGATAPPVHRLMEVTNHDYASITAGMLSTYFAISPPDARGRFFLVTAHARPWIASRWRDLHLAVHAPADEPAHPRELLGFYDAATLGNFVGHVTTEPDAFEVRYETSERLTDEVTRRGIARFERKGDRFVRVPPFAVMARDLPSAWLDASWDEASQFTLPSARAALRPLHAKLRRSPRGSAELRLTRDPSSSEPTRPMLIDVIPGLGSPPPPPIRFRIVFADGSAYVAAIEPLARTGR